MEAHKEFLELLGYVYLQQSKVADAQKVYESLRILFPGDLRIALALGYTFYALGQFKQCLDVLETMGADGEKRYPNALVLKSKALWGLGKKDEAREFLKSYLVKKRGIHGNAS